MLKNLSRLLLAGAILAAAGAFCFPEDKNQQSTLAGYFGVLLGCWTVVWGLRGIQDGRIRVKHRYAAREKNPITFWAVVLVFRILLGSVLVIGAWWHLMTEGLP